MDQPALTYVFRSCLYYYMQMIAFCFLKLLLVYNQVLIFGIDIALNVTKTKILFFRRRGTLSFNDNWYYNGNELEIVDFFPYLGMIFSYTGSYTQTQLILAQQGRKAMFSLRSKLKRFVNINSVVYCDQ